MNNLENKIPLIINNHLTNVKIAIVVSEFNHNITHQLLEGALTQLKTHHIKDENIFVAQVPGAVEIPLAAKLLAKKAHYSAIICLGAVIRGETSHFDYVCQQVSSGIQKVMLKHEIPVIFGVLTTDDVKQAEERVGGKHGHKGKEAADAALSMISLIKQLNEEEGISSQLKALSS